MRDDFKRGKYPDVILNFTVLRRLDCVLAQVLDVVAESRLFRLVTRMAEGPFPRRGDPFEIERRFDDGDVGLTHVD